MCRTKERRQQNGCMYETIYEIHEKTDIYEYHHEHLTSYIL